MKRRKGRRQNGEEKRESSTEMREGKSVGRKEIMGKRAGI